MRRAILATVNRNSATLSMNGILEEGALPGLMRELYVGRKTGVLSFARGDQRYSVRFQRGHLVNATTNVTEDRLGEMLARHGLLSTENLDRATDLVVREKKRLGQALLELKAFDTDGLESAIARHVHEVLTRVFGWADGTWEFVEEPEGAMSTDEITLKLSTGDVILEAVHGIHDPDVIRYALGDIDRVLALSTDPLLRFQNVTLTPTDGFMLSRVDGTLSAREITQIAGRPPEETLKSLFGLLCTGIVEWTGGVKKAKAPAPSTRPAGPTVPVTAGPVSAPSPPAQAPPPPPSAAPPVPSPTAASPTAGDPAPPPPVVEGPAAERRREIMEVFAGLKEGTHFDVLGLKRGATDAQVKDAYFRLARRFHPDVHHDASLGDLRDKLEAVFIRLGQAYEVLKNPKTRASYEERLGSRGFGPAIAPLPPEPPAPPPDPAEELRKAQEAIRIGEKLYEKEKFWDAIQVLEPAVPIVSGRMKQRGHVALARCYLKNPNWAKRAEEQLLGAAREDPKNVDAHFILGTIYKERGLHSRALSMFRKVVEINPDHEEAQAILAAAAPPVPPPDEGGGGLISRLFKRA